MEIDNLDSGSKDEQVIPVRGKRINVYALPESIVIILRGRGSLQDCRELTPSEVHQVDLYKDNTYCFDNTKKNKYEYVRYPASSKNLRVFLLKNGGGGGGSSSVSAKLTP